MASTVNLRCIHHLDVGEGRLAGHWPTQDGCNTVPISAFDSQLFGWHSRCCYVASGRKGKTRYRRGDTMTQVLIVEDDEATRHAERMILEDAGYEVFEATDGGPALDRLHTDQGGMVVLLDKNMPNIDG